MQPADIEIEAAAWAINEAVVKVEFFVNERKIDEDNDSSEGWKTNWREYARGTYSLTATATDCRGITATSSPIEITINPPE